MAKRTPLSDRRRLQEDKTSGQHKALAIYASSETDGNMLYAVQAVVPDPFLFFAWRGKRYVVVSDLEVSRLRKASSAHEVFSFRQFDLCKNKRGYGGAPVADVLRRVFDRWGIRRIEVPWSFPLGLADALRRRGMQVRAKEDPFFPLREIKKKEEVARIREALAAAEYGMSAALEALRASRIDRKAGGRLSLGGQPLTSERLREIIHRAVLEKGAVAKNTIVACGREGYDPHETGAGPLMGGEPIIIDIFPRSEKSGYYGDITRTFVRGRGSDRIREMYHAVRKAQEKGIAMATPRTRCSTIHEAVCQVFEKLGFRTIQQEDGCLAGFIHGTGHGVGLDIHERPFVSNKPQYLRAGNVITIEPGLYYPDVGGVRLEDMIHVTAAGPRNLTRFPKFLEI